MSNLNDSVENLELGDAVVGSSSVSILTKSIRVLLATAVLGSVAAYGALTVKPELVEYLSFIPGMEPVQTQCTAGSCGPAQGAQGTESSDCLSEGPSACVSEPFVDQEVEASAEVIGTSEL